MPDITEFNAGDLQLRPSQSGIEANVRSAYRLGAFGRQQAQALDQSGRAIGSGIAAAGQAAVQSEDHREISGGATDGSEKFVQWEQQWNKIANDPNTNASDPTVAKKFIENTLDPQLEDFQNQFHTRNSQEWATRYVDQVRQHFATKTAADQSTMAGIASHDHLIKTANTWATAAYADPSSLGTAIGILGHSADGMIQSSPTISPEDAARVRGPYLDDAYKQAVSAAVHGVIARGGDWQTFIKNGVTVDGKKFDLSPYVNAPEIQQFERTEKFYRTATEVQQKQIVKTNEQIATHNMNMAVNDSWKTNVDANGDLGPGFVKDMKELPTKYHDAPEAADVANKWIGVVKKQQETAAKAKIDDPAVVGGLLKTISNPDLSESDATLAIYKADADHPMATRTRSNLLQIAKDMRSINDPFLKQDMEVAKAAIIDKVPGVGGNPEQVQKYTAFYYDFIHNKYLPAKIAGNLPPNALDMNDPKSMISQAITTATGGPSVTVPAAVHANGGVGAPLPVYTAPAGGAAKPPTVTDKAGYDKLPPGAAFVDPSGKLWTKPAANTPTLQPGQM